jgi:gluconolactonase
LNSNRGTHEHDTAWFSQGGRCRRCAAAAGPVFAQGKQLIERFDPALDRIIAVNQPIRELGGGYGGPMGSAEGPLWWKEGGYLLFSDIHNDRRMKYTPGQGVTLFKQATASVMA